MKEIYLISLIIIYITNIIKCDDNSQNIGGKVCAVYEGVTECNINGGLNKKKCEDEGCCYTKDKFLIFSYNKKCFKPSCIEGCNKCSNLKSCEECEENYYLTEDTKLCFNSLKENYYIDGKFLKRCHSNCLTCHSSAINNIPNIIYDSITIDMNCITCKNDYYILNGTNNCYDYSFSNEGYYLKDNDKFYPCDPNCSTCSDKKNDESNNCLTCDNSQNLYLVEGLNNCVSGEYSGYYLNYIQKKYIKCYFSCKECNWSYEPKSNKHNCKECIDNYYKLGESNCYNDSNAIDGYYLDKDEEPPIWKE